MTDFVRGPSAADGIVYVPIANVSAVIFRDNRYTVHLRDPAGTNHTLRVEDPLDIAHLESVLGEALPEPTLRR
jgi:hypothetical protein